MTMISTVENNIYFRKGRKLLFKNFEVFEDRQEMS